MLRRQSSEADRMELALLSRDKVRRLYARTEKASRPKKVQQKYSGGQELKKDTAGGTTAIEV